MDPKGPKNEHLKQWQPIGINLVLMAWVYSISTHVFFSTSNSMWILNPFFLDISMHFLVVVIFQGQSFFIYFHTFSNIFSFMCNPIPSTIHCNYIVLQYPSQNEHIESMQSVRVTKLTKKKYLMKLSKLYSSLVIIDTFSFYPPNNSFYKIYNQFHHQHSI